MSNSSNWSRAGNDGYHSSNSNNQEYKNSNYYTTQNNQNYSSMDTYLNQPESHERTALAQGTSDPKKAAKSHRKRIAKEIGEVERKSRK